MLVFLKMDSNTGVPHWETHGSSIIMGGGGESQFTAGFPLGTIAAAFARIKSL